MAKQEAKEIFAAGAFQVIPDVLQKAVKNLSLNKETDKSNEMTFYSLYMHLAPTVFMDCQNSVWENMRYPYGFY